MMPFNLLHADSNLPRPDNYPLSLVGIVGQWHPRFATNTNLESKLGRDSIEFERLDAFMQEAFAPWVKQLNIRPLDIIETGAQFIVPQNADLTRIGGIVCGQALSAIADTVGVLTLIAHNRDSRIMTTVDMTTHFLRPIMDGEISVAVGILSNGRRMATTRIEFRQNASPKICASATCAYAYIDS